MQGADKELLLQIAGHPYEDLCDEEFRVGSDVFNKVTEAAVEATGDEYFGLHAGEHMSLGAAGLIGQITQSSSTVKEALDYCCEFAMLGCRAIPMSLELEDGLYKLSLIPDPIWAKESPLSVKQTIDGMMAFNMREYHALTHEKHYPVKIEFGFKRPPNYSEYERVLTCPIYYGKQHSAIYYDKKQLEEPVVTSDYNLLRILVAYAQEKVAQIEQAQGFYNLVKRSVINLVKPDFPSIEQVAANLNLSVRTLQRKLKEEGYTFKEIIETLRRDFAMSYLKDKSLSINEIAYLLSYADGSAFIRTFKRWTGETPSAYREKLG